MIVSERPPGVRVSRVDEHAAALDVGVEELLRLGVVDEPAEDLRAERDRRDGEIRPADDAPCHRLHPRAGSGRRFQDRFGCRHWVPPSRRVMSGGDRFGCTNPECGRFVTSRGCRD
jgi:hypothetical protein